MSFFTAAKTPESAADAAATYRDKLAADIYAAGHFKLPIEYLADTASDTLHKLPRHVAENLELDATIYDCLYPGAVPAPCRKHILLFPEPAPLTQHHLHRHLATHFTSNVDFLRSYQNIVAAMGDPTNRIELPAISAPNLNKMFQQWAAHRSVTDFKSRYYFMEWDWLDWLNSNETFLQIMNMLNIVSPIISILSPFMILVTPFFMLRSYFGASYITVASYISILKEVLRTHAVGKLFIVGFAAMSLKERAWAIVSVAYYIYSMYVNGKLCISFNAKLTQICRFFADIVEYIDATIGCIQHQHMMPSTRIAHQTMDPAHQRFYATMQTHLRRLLDWRATITRTHQIPQQWSLQYAGQLGGIMHTFYRAYHDVELHDTMMYTFGLHQYTQLLRGVCGQMRDKVLASCGGFVADKGLKLRDNYYGPHWGGVAPSPQRNRVNMVAAKGLIISGPNASGKTTLMKSVLVNVILTQQMGVGFYAGRGTNVVPYTDLHCYLNIPDTSGRDSLFQAEARRCKEILDAVMVAETTPRRHFVIFDELFSGTNPEEAVKASAAFVRYLSRQPRVQFMLTTHFRKVCKQFQRDNSVQNWQMKCRQDVATGALTYTYKLRPGITRIKGGMQVLRDMNYPAAMFSGDASVEAVEMVC